MNVAGIDTPIELLATLLVVLGPIGVAAVPLYFAHRRVRSAGSKMAEVTDDVKAIREQTENDHETNMRVDLDKTLVGIEKALNGINRIEMRQNQQGNELQELGREVSRDIGGLREEMRTERSERAEADRNIRELIQRRPH
ncbi:DUF2746 domain-containing protein [Mycobacteroides chelonae]|uniref:DUF2746 domain-containing protein n=1 Tax=Mycobacteroides chelonae TaxID=1774 RepID=UPI00099226B8|nr:DUF2746 domain-containing protein [Mycobacteroides chelonae]